MIHTAEKELGRELVLRQPGGKNGGTAEISEAGWELIKKYEKLEASIEEFAAKEYPRIKIATGLPARLRIIAELIL